MSSSVIDDLSTAWQADSSALWTVNVAPGSSNVPGPGATMQIDAAAGPAGAAAPSAVRQLAAPLDLRAADELRFWMRSSRPAKGSPASPFYLALELATDVAAQPGWRRLLPVKLKDTWELHCTWLGDVAPGLRQAVGVLRLHSLDATVAFRASLGEILATTPEPIRDVDDALVERIGDKYSVLEAGVPTSVPAIIDVPESPGTRTAPYVLITPWSVLACEPHGTATEIVDNYTATGSHTRPARRILKLEYRIDAFVTARAQKSHLLARIVADLAGQGLRVGGELLELVPFEPDPYELAHHVTPGRTPLFYRLLVPMESGARQYRPQAVPFMTVGQPNESASEAVVA